MQKREAPKEIAKGHELAWLRLRSDSMPFLTRFFPKPLFPFLHEDFSLLLLGRAGGNGRLRTKSLKGMNSLGFACAQTACPF